MMEGQVALVEGQALVMELKGLILSCRALSRSLEIGSGRMKMVAWLSLGGLLWVCF